MILYFNNYVLELFEDPTYKIGSIENNFTYDFVYYDNDYIDLYTSRHGVKIFEKGTLIKSAIICAFGGTSNIGNNSAIIDNENLLICCGNKVFCLQLPSLLLNWVTETDESACFAIYKANNAIFTHGEIEITRLDENGNIVWQKSLMDIIVNINNAENCFILHENHIELQDFSSNKYTIDFNGNFNN